MTKCMTLFLGSAVDKREVGGELAVILSGNGKRNIYSVHSDITLKTESS